MPRKRMIDPEFWSDEEIGTWSIETRLFYVGLWNFADDEGRLRAHPMLLRSQIFPYDENLDINKLKGEVGKKVFWYSINGQEYGFVKNLLKHQRIDRPTPSQIPPPPKAELEAFLNSYRKLDEGSSKARRRLALKLKEVKLREVKLSEAPTSAGSEPADPPKLAEGSNPQEPRHLDLARYLEAQIRVNVPHHKFQGKNYLEAWAREFRLMETRDKIPFESIKAVLEWSQQDEFWRINMLSAGTFREKFGRLEAKARAGGGNGRGEHRVSQIGANKKPTPAEAELDKRLRAEYDAVVKKYMAEHGYKTEDEIPFDEIETFSNFKARRLREAGQQRAGR